MLNINNAFINTIDANIIARKYMHELENYIAELYNIDFSEPHKEEIKLIYEEFTNELDSESQEGLARDWNEITDIKTVTENQIKKIYYELRKNKNKLSFTDADNIIKILIDYNQYQ